MQAKDKIAVTSRSFSKNPVLRAELLKKYSAVTFNDEGLSLRGESLEKFLKGHTKAIIALEPITEELLKALPDLRVISKFGVGLNTLDLDALRNHNIRLGWMGGVNKRAVSELTLAMILTVLRHIPKAHADAKLGIWKQPQGRQLSGKTVGIIGYGHIGQDVAKLLQGFDCKILIYDPYVDSESNKKENVAFVGLETLLEQADIVTLHIALSDESRNIINKERLALMKSTAIIVNSSRGGLIDELALKQSLVNGKIEAAALDVFDTEPPYDLELLQLPNMFALPHIGGSTKEATLAMGRAAIDGLDNNEVPEF